MDIATLIDKLIKFIEIGSTCYGTVLLNNYLTNKQKEKQKPSLSDTDHYESIQPILDNIREQTGADVVAFWEGSNGETTLSGFHKKKLSLVCESVVEDKYSGLGEMDNIPVQNFKRNIDALRDSEHGYIVSYEFEKFDELGALHQSYGIGTLCAFRILTGKSIKKWTGILCVGFNDKPKLLTDADLAWLNVQSSRIGNKLTI